MKVIAVYDSDGCLLFLAKDYKTAVDNLFGQQYIRETDEIMIDGHWTTIRDYFGEDGLDIMASVWDKDDFNEFWQGDFEIKEYEVIE